MGFIEAFLGTEKLPVILALGFLLLAYMLYKAQLKRDKFDLRDLIIDPTTTKISLSKFSQLIALGVSAWAFVYLTLHDKLSEFYMTIFMTSWAGFNAIHKAIDTFGNKTTDVVEDKSNGTDK